MSPRPSPVAASETTVTLYHAAVALLAYEKPYSLSGLKPPAFDTMVVLANLEATTPGFDPLAPLDETGLPFMPALLRRAKSPRSVLWLDTWAKRHGTDAVFAVPEGDEGVVMSWMRRAILPELTKKQSLSQEKADVAAWLIRHAPEDEVGALPLTEWREALSASTDKKHTQGLLDAVNARAPAASVGLRPLARWVQDLPDGVDVSMPVVGLSGQERTLGEFRTLFAEQSWHSSSSAKTGGDHILHLPQPPHLRRDEFVKNILLNPDRSLDERRALLWSISEAKMDIVHAFLNRLELAREKGDARLVEMGMELLTARDALGRGFVGFLMGNDPRMAGAIYERLRMEKRPVAETLEEEALSADGAGIAEQELKGLFALQLQPHLKDAFERRADRIKNNDGVLLGSSDRRSMLVDFVVDSGAGLHSPSLSPTHLGEALLRTSTDDEERLRLEQALLLRRLMGFFKNVRVSGSYLDTKETEKLRNEVWRYQNATDQTFLKDTFVAHVAQHGLCLHLDQDDWRQLGLFGREKLRGTLADSSGSPASSKQTLAESIFAELDTVMTPALEARRLQSLLPEAAPQPRARRARM